MATITAWKKFIGTDLAAGETFLFSSPSTKKSKRNIY